MNAPGISAHFPQQTSSAAQSGGGGGPNQRLKVEDALQYLEEVKQMYGGRPKVYNDFLDIMKEFKSQHLDTCGVITRVAKLFHGKPKLICGFNSFLPNGYRIEIAEEEEEQHQIRLRMPNDEIKIIMTEDGTLVDPKQITGIITPGKSSHRLPVSQMMTHVPTVMMGVSPTLSHGPQSRTMSDQDPVIMYSMVPGSGADALNQPTYVRLKHPMGGEAGSSFQQPDSSLTVGGDYNAAVQIDKLSSYGLLQQPPTGISPAINVDDGDSAKFSSSLFGSLSPNASVGVPRGGQPFESAIHYVNKIKRRFENDPAIYKRFLDILQQYQGNAKHPSSDSREPVEQRVYREVAALFRHHPDLLEEFTTFMPETAQHHRHAMLVEREKLGKRKYTRRKDRMDPSNKQNADNKYQNENKEAVRVLGSPSSSGIQANKVEAEDDWQLAQAGTSPGRKAERGNSAAVRGGRGGRGGTGTPSLISSGPGSRGGGRGGNNRRKLIGTLPSVSQQEQPPQPVGARGGRRPRGGKTLAVNNSFGATTSQQQRDDSAKLGGGTLMRTSSRADDDVDRDSATGGMRRRKRSGEADENVNENDNEGVTRAPPVTAASVPQKKKPKLLKTSFRVKKFVNKNSLLRDPNDDGNDAECTFEPLPSQLMPATLAAASHVLSDETFQLYAFIRRCQRVMPPALAQALFKLMELYVARFCDLDFFLDNASQLMIKSYPKLFDQLVRCCERLRGKSTKTNRSSSTTAPAAHTVELSKASASGARGGGGSMLSAIMGNKMNKLGANWWGKDSPVQSLDAPGTFGFWTGGAGASRATPSTAAAGKTSSAHNRDINLGNEAIDKNELLSRKRLLFSITGNTSTDGNGQFDTSGTVGPHQRGVPVRRAVGGGGQTPPTSVDGAEARTMLDPKELKQFGPSYRVLPDDFPNLKCSGRSQDASLKDILNDRFVSCPVYSEGSGFVISKKNPAEDLLFRVEDERYEMDMLVSGAEYAIRDMKWLQERMKCMKPSVLEQFRWKQAQNHRRIVMLLYGDNGPLIIRSLTEDPQITTPMVLKRLEDKWSDWLKMRNEMQDLWGEQERRNWARALDYTGQVFKATDAKRLKSRVLVNEIEKAYDQQQQQTEAAFPPDGKHAVESSHDGHSTVKTPNGLPIPKAPHFELKYRNDEYGLALADDVLFLLEHELERYNFTKKEKRVLRNFLGEIHYRMFGYRPSDVPTHDVLSARSSDGETGGAPLTHLEELAHMLLPSDGIPYSASDAATAKANGDDAGGVSSPDVGESVDQAADMTGKKVASSTRPSSSRREEAAFLSSRARNEDNTGDNGSVGSDDNENETDGTNGGSANGRRNGANRLRFGPLSDGSSKHRGAISLSLLGAGGGGSSMMAGGSGLAGLGAGAELDDLPLHERLPDYHYHSLSRIRTKSDPMLPLPWIELQCIMQDVMPTMNMYEIELSEAAKQRAKYRSRLLAYMRWLTLTNQQLPCFDAVRRSQQLTLCGGNHLYTLMRYHHTLTERLDILYRRVVRVFEDNNNGDAALLAAATSSTGGAHAAAVMRNDVARLCRVRKPLHPTLYWCVFMDRLMKFTDGNIDVPQFEDDMRELFLDKCQYAFNLALIINYAVKQLHMLYSSESGKKVIEHFTKPQQPATTTRPNSAINSANGQESGSSASEKNAGQQERAAYINKMQEIMQDNNCYCITSTNNGSKLEVYLLEAQVPEEETVTKASTWEDAVSMFLDPNAVGTAPAADKKPAATTTATSTNISSTLASVKAAQPLFLISTHAEWGRGKKGRFNDKDNDADDGGAGNGNNTEKSAGGGSADSGDEDEDDDDEETTATTGANVAVQQAYSSTASSASGSAAGEKGESGESPAKPFTVQADGGNVQLKATIKVMRFALAPSDDGQSAADTGNQPAAVGEGKNDGGSEAAISKPKLFVQNARSPRVTETQLQRRETQDRSAALKRFVATAWMPKAELNRDDDRSFQTKMHEGLARNKHGSNSETPYFPYLVHRQKDSEQRDGMNPPWAPDNFDDDIDDNEDTASKAANVADDSRSQQQPKSPGAKPRVRVLSTHSPSSSPRFKRLASPGAVSLPRKGGAGASTRRGLPIAGGSMPEVADESSSFVSPFKRPLSRDVAMGMQQQISSTVASAEERNISVIDDANTPPGAPAVASLAAKSPPPPLPSFASSSAETDTDEYGARSVGEDDDDGTGGKRTRRASGYSGTGSSFRGDDAATRREANVTPPSFASASDALSSGARHSAKHASSSSSSNTAKDAAVSNVAAAQR